MAEGREWMYNRISRTSDMSSQPLTCDTYMPSMSRATNRAIRGGANISGRRHNTVNRDSGRSLTSGEHTVRLNGSGLPNNLMLDGNPSFGSNSDGQQPNVTPDVVSLTQPRSIEPDQRLQITIGELKVNESVKKSLETIATDLFTGWPANYGNLDPTKREKYISRFSDEYKWAPSDSGKMRSHLHSQFSTRYQARMSNIRVNILQNHIHDFAQDPDYKRFIPFRPQHVTPETWIKLCDYWNTDEWKKKSKVGKRNRAGNLREGERPAKTKGRKSKEILFSEIEIEIGRKPTFLDFAEKWVVADTSTSEPVPTSFAVHMVTYRQRMEEMYGLDRTKYPPFDSQLWKEITGDPKKGRWVGVPAQLSHPELFQPSKPLEDTYGLLDDRIVKMEAEIETMRVGMSELKEQNETMRLENTEQRTSFTTAMRNIWAILISMGVTNSNLINHQFLPGGSSTNQCTSSLFAQQKLNPMPPFGQQQQPGSFGQLLEMNYAQAHLFDQPSPFAATGHPQPPSSNPHITTLHQAGATRGTPSFPVRQLRDESSSSDDDSEE
ncbi:unnamed protein product [Cuscuta epithymum]|uniref:Transposase, Ptta/En/Spm, plant n=1 Tax=Cuscuta epithymum TaxID=186058 RepID=A0AAV0F643_9ASTE|nr:unnamed protein product [Cuscuta epithymum]